MRILPRSRPRRIVAGVVVLGVVAASALHWDELLFALKLAFPDPAYDAARDRDSEPAAVGIALALPSVQGADGPTGEDPSISLATVAVVESPTAVADPPGPGPVLVTTQPGLHLGWNEVEGDGRYDGESQPGFTDPVVTYQHDEAGGCSVTGGYLYRGEAAPGLYGRYLFGDYCGGWVRGVPADNPTADPTELLANLGPVTSFAELEDGELLLLGPEGIRSIGPG